MKAREAPPRDRTPLIIVGSALSGSKLKGLDPDIFPVFLCREDVRQMTSAVAAIPRCLLFLRAEFLSQLAPDQQPQLRPEASVVVVVPAEDGSVIELIRQGCRGVLSRNLRAPMVRRAVTSIVEGQIWAPRKILSVLVEESMSRNAVPGLTMRENAVLRLVRQGHTNQEIADKLEITRETVRWYLRELRGKVGRSVRDPQMAEPVERIGTGLALVRYSSGRPA